MSQMPGQFGSFHNRPSVPLTYASPDDSMVVARFFNAVYAWMCVGLAVTAVVAYWVASQPNIVMQVGRLFLPLVIVELVLVGTISMAINRISAGVATLLFLLYAAINGLTLAGLFFVYTQGVLASGFAITAGMFGSMSLYGFLTRRDLSGWGSYLFMGLIGLVIASVVSLFWHPTLLTVAFNYIGVILFVGLTAYDTQKLKVWAIQTAGNSAMAGRLAVNGTLTLYLDFLNLFLFVLRILGGRDSR